MEALKEIESAVGRLAQGAGRSVVGVGHRWAVGSGIVVGAGRVVTNAHNVRRDEVAVTFADGRTETGRVAGIDIDGDLAVLDVDTGEVPALGWADGNGTPALGAPVFALSNPGGRGLRVTFGFVSGTDRAFRGPRGRRIGGSLEHTAPLLPGSSGGPVVDAEGRVVGINTNRLGEGFYLAIPADSAMVERVERLSGGESPRRARLGVGLAPPQVASRLRRAVGLPEAEGLLIRDVEPEGPAGRAGLREGDLIVAAGGRAVARFDDLHDVLRGTEPEDALEVKVLRGVDEVTVTVTLED